MEEFDVIEMIYSYSITQMVYNGFYLL